MAVTALVLNPNFGLQIKHSGPHKQAVYHLPSIPTTAFCDYTQHNHFPNPKSNCASNITFLSLKFLLEYSLFTVLC